VGDGDAICALDWGWEAAWVAVDGEPRQRWCSGGVWWSEQRKGSKMGVCKCKSESVGSSRICPSPEEGVVAREQELASRRKAWRFGQWRRDVERREQASARPGSRRARRRRARGIAQSGAGAAGARHMAGEGGDNRAQRKQRRRELEVDDGD
jgi:hypothetical protein